ncbi:phage integrase N-terminal SAM-like domain-containing protein [Desulfallas sp. Bu1-1]|uniref:phage integrase N-terminal SAM-like domain-containing protein n=1 Tax=Desulfallas sp. Bu1-1 TaxID=2787620 RepID=UPI001A9BB22A|nr:phage integrase N-terminal SAM-like domain-containing protein [Desulfallas sp. Bu1-1]
MQDFLYWKQAQGVSERTIQDYRLHISQFFKRHPKVYDPKTLKKNLLENMAQPVKPSTFNLRLTYLKVFFNWCIQEGIFTENPLSGFRRRKDEGEYATWTPTLSNSYSPCPIKKHLLDLETMP